MKGAIMAKHLVENKKLSITMSVKDWNMITDYISDTIIEFIRSDDSRYHHYPWLHAMVTARSIIDNGITEAYHEEWVKEEEKNKLERPIEISEDCNPNPDAKKRYQYTRLNPNKITCKKIKSVDNIQSHEGRREFTYTVDTDEGEAIRIFTYDSDVCEDLKHVMDVIENWYRGKDNDDN